MVTMQSALPKHITSQFLHVDNHSQTIAQYARNQQTKNGSALFVTILFTAVLSLVIASLLKSSMTEMRLNKSHFLHQQASNSAESMVEYGFAELQKRGTRQTSFTANELRDEPLLIPSTAKEFYLGSNVVFEELELIGGKVPSGEWHYIDPNEPSNQEDPQKGKRVFERNVKVYGKGVTQDPRLGKKEVYCSQVLSVRDAPLFTHAIFYNMDLEFHPGPSMEIQGPVHSNGDIYLQTASQLRFHSTVMTHGDFFHGYKPTGGTHVSSHKGQVLIKDADGDWKDVYTGGSRSSDSSYVDSHMGEDWNAAAKERWGGNVGSSTHEVPQLNPVGIGNYIPDDPDTSRVNEKHNPAYALIEPQVPDSNSNYKGDQIQKEQFSYKAGLVLKVDKVASPTSPHGYDYELSAYNYHRESQLNPKSPPKKNNNGTLKTQDLPLDKIEKKMGRPLLTVNRYAESGGGTPIGGLYDRRQTTGMDIIELDMSILAEMINDGEKNGENRDPWNGQFHLNPGKAMDWNGVVYVELPYDASSSSRSDSVMPADRNVALRISNADVVPNPDFGKSSGYDEGFTLATNGQLYVQGHFNSDGNPSTGSSTKTDDGNTHTSKEATAALYADSITILSNSFDDTRTKLSPGYRQAEYTEVSAALVTGLLPTVPNGWQRSGGAHNLPRFLEGWIGVEFRYRGSLVALYESEAGTAPMRAGYSAWYYPPKRNWGYNQLFAEGIYPPGTPNTRDYRRTNFQYLTANEYGTKVEGFGGGSRGHKQSKR